VLTYAIMVVDCDGFGEFGEFSEQSSISEQCSAVSQVPGL